MEGTFRVFLYPSGQLVHESLNRSSAALAYRRTKCKDNEMVIFVGRDGKVLAKKQRSRSGVTHLVH